jgi:NADPH:quinone reductase and related Zn-dependent oxidoreductases
MAVSHKALFVDDHAKFSIVERNGNYTLDDGEVLIETIFSGVNPADIKHATHLGIVNTVIGYDFCGRIMKAKEQSKWNFGDIVAGYTPSGVGRQSKYGTHQDYIVCPESMLFKVPANLPQEDAACLTVVAMTAADALFNLFDLQLPSQKKRTESQSGPLLIWGASSSVGLCALQFAAASGCYPIFVTASTRHHETLKKLGATRCFDYSSPTVYEDMNEALKSLGSGSIQYAIDAVGPEPNPLAADGIQSILSQSVKLLSVVVRNDKRFGMPVATSHQDFRIQPPGVPHVINIPGRPEALKKTWPALLWAIEAYGQSFRLPPVEVFRGSAEEALTELHKVANGSRGYGKLAIAHPIK